MCLEIMYLIHMYKKDLSLKTFNGRYTIKPNWTKSTVLLFWEHDTYAGMYEPI